MRSRSKGMAAAIAAAVLIATLTGCATGANSESTSEDEVIACSQVTTASIKDAEGEVKDAETALDEAVPFKKDDAKAALATAKTKVETLNTRATECEAETTEDATAVSTIEACGDARFEQVFIDRAATAKVDPRYEGEVRPIITNASLTEEQKFDAIIDVELKLSASNAQTLAFWAYGAGLLDNPNNWKDLVEGGKIEGGECLTDKGKMLWAEYKGAITGKGVSLAVSEANPNSTNTGVNGEQAVVDIQTGISGDMMTIVITFADGSQMKKLVRCGNLELPSAPPGIPPGTTDNPEKKPEESSSQNPANPGYIVRDNGEHQVNWNNGNTDPRGYQPSAEDVAAAQRAAEQKAAAEQAERDRIAQAARDAANNNGAGTVETSTEELGESAPTGPDW